MIKKSVFNKMVKLATSARNNAYAPYSKFKVGACVYSEKKYYTGCNVENSSFPEGICAESNAIGSMICAGKRKIDAIIIIGNKHELTAPCGGCRQRIAEFSNKNTPVYLIDDDNEIKELKIEDLLPFNFSLKGEKK